MLTLELSAGNVVGLRMLTQCECIAIQIKPAATVILLSVVEIQPMSSL